MRHIIPILLLIIYAQISAAADNNSPWGRGKVHEIEYTPQKVVYDVSVSSISEFEHVLDRASYLSKIYQADPFNASIVIVMHGGEIPFFAIHNYNRYRELMIRAQSLTYGEVIKFRMCKIAAKGQGFDPQDIHGFVELVPMADAELVRLQQQEGYAYMR